MRRAPGRRVTTRSSPLAKAFFKATGWPAATSCREPAMAVPVAVGGAVLAPFLAGAAVVAVACFLADQIRPEILAERAARCTANIERLEREIAQADLDALIVIGDDQHEQFLEDNIPAIMIYAGDTILNNPLNMPLEAPQWWRRARSPCSPHRRSCTTC